MSHTPTPPQPDTTDGYLEAVKKQLDALLSEHDTRLWDDLHFVIESAASPENALNQAKQIVAALQARDIRIQAEAQLKAMDKVFELAPDKMFGHWKHDDVIKFFERLKEYDRSLKAILKEKTKDE